MRILWKFGAVAAIAIQAFSANPANAGNFWSTVASGCVPEAKSIQANRYRNPNSVTVGLSSKNVKPAAFICPVTARTNLSEPGPDTMALTYKDPTGQSSTGRVEATLYGVNQQTGVIAQIAAITSDISSATGIRTEMFDGIDPDAFDFDNEYYYVRVVVDRGSTNQDVRFIGTKLGATCGNGAIAAGEQCDQGNITEGDGCSSSCVVEDGYVCTGVPSVCSML